MKVKANYDKYCRKKPAEYKKRDRIVIKSRYDRIWLKATVLEPAREPRSYWFRKEENARIVNINTSQIEKH